MKFQFPFLMLAGFALLTWAAPSRSDTPFDPSPIGNQKVLVLLMEYPLNDPCPNPNEKCNVDPLGYDQYVLPPRHSPEEWSALFNSVSARWWLQASYGQSSWEFTVLRDPFTQDGWWPAAHSFQDYKLNDSIWVATKTSPPNAVLMVPDSVQSVVNTVCGSLFNQQMRDTCATLSQYQRVIVMPNFQSFGASTVTGPYTVATTPNGPLVASVTSANEDQSDRTLSPIMHELGHQIAEQSHYGDCSRFVTFTSFNPTLPGGPIECISGWDIMGFSSNPGSYPYSIADFGGYSKVSRGIIDLASVPSFDLIGGPPFSQTFTLNPTEIEPTAANPGLIRLSTGDLSWPQLSGYFVECRAPIGNDAPNQFPEIAGVSLPAPESGVLITNVHEFSTSDVPSAPAYHIERPLNPDPTANNGFINHAALQPGQFFQDPVLGLTVRFNSFVQLPGGGSQCSVSVAYDQLLPPIAQRSIRFAGNLKNGAQIDLAHANGTSSIASDIAYNNNLVATPAVSSDVPVIAPWPGHHNPLAVRVHNRSTGPIHEINLAVRVRQPAVITDECSMVMDALPSAPAQPGVPDQTGLLSAVLMKVPAAGSAVAALDWAPSSDQSVEVDAVATGPANQVTAVSRAAFQFHSPQTAGQGITSTFRIARGSMCTGPQDYFVSPTVSQQDWNVALSTNSVTLNPGEQGDVSVTIVPIHTVVGESAQISVNVLVPMQMLADTSSFDPRAPSIIPPGVHLMPVGSMTVLAKMTNGAGVVSLGCASGDRERRIGDDDHSGCRCSEDGLKIAGTVTPGVAGSPVTVEYRSPTGVTFSHVVYTVGNGRYHDSLREERHDVDLRVGGDWSVQARWSGGPLNDPTESPSVIFHVRPRHR